jgi:geranylgeranyl diphosphate synthase type I
MTELPGAFRRYRGELDDLLCRSLSARDSPLYDMMRYHFGWIDAQGNPSRQRTGKYLRPTLCLLTCEAVGGDYRRALPAAAAVELVHNYSLIHDDIQDDDRERRHRATVWSLWGKAQAINAGTAMRLLANVTLESLSENDISVEKRMRAQHLLDDTTLDLIEGQYLDISFESRLDIGTADYLTMIEGKTAALMACSMELGALLGSENGGAATALGTAGRDLGMAFQIRDDILGIWGDENETGKPAGSDVRRRKNSLPIIYAMEAAEARAKSDLAGLYRKKKMYEDEVAAVLRILESLDAKGHAQERVKVYSQQAMKAIDKLRLVPSAKENLRQVVAFLTDRGY